MGHAVVIASLGALGPLLVKLTALLAGEYGRLKGVHREILSLRCELASMHATVQRYVMLEDPNVQVKEWISMVRELAYDVEDTIDRFILRLNGGGGWHGGFKKLYGKTVRRLKTLGARRGIADQVDKLKGRIKHVKELKECYKLDDTMAHVMVVNGPREDLANWTLVQGNNSAKHHHEVLSIVSNTDRSSIPRLLDQSIDLERPEHPNHGQRAMEFESVEEDWIMLDPDGSDDVLAISYYRSATSDDDDESTRSDPVHGFNFYDGSAALLMGDGTHGAPEESRAYYIPSAQR